MTGTNLLPFFIPKFNINRMDCEGCKSVFIYKEMQREKQTNKQTKQKRFIGTLYSSLEISALSNNSVFRPWIRHWITNGRREKSVWINCKFKSNGCGGLGLGDQLQNKEIRWITCEIFPDNERIDIETGRLYKRFTRETLGSEGNYNSGRALNP